MFSADNQLKLKKSNFELTCPEENIWIVEEGDQSITISGDDKLIEAIWQNYDGDFDDYSDPDMDNILQWACKMLKKKR